MLAGLILAVYAQVRKHDFVAYDDKVYITENEAVLKGLSWENCAWAFTTAHGSNWHPLTWLSHMLDVELFGLWAGGHHLVNVFIHILSTLLLFVTLNRMTNDFWRSLWIAAVFALHPLRAESVAWAAERKDVLSTFFWMAAMWAYVGYARHGSAVRYLAVVLLFALGLLSKPMLVTLPLVLLLLDYWPLDRLSGKAVLEKIPLLVLTGISCIVTYLVQQSGGAVKTLDYLPPAVRLGNALVSYVAYIGKMFWPINLAVFYPHPGRVIILPTIAAGLWLLGFVGLMVWTRRRCKYLVTGGLWYLVTLLPVIGLIQVGDQARADRYTYVPGIGVLIIIAWAAPQLLDRLRPGKIIPEFLGSASVAVLGILSIFQVGYWRNSLTLFEHALAVTEDNYLAHCGRGNALLEEKRIDEAIAEYRQLLQIKPNYYEVHKIHGTLGKALLERGKIEEALVHLRQAVSLKATPDGYLQLGNALREKGELDEAVDRYRKSIQLQDDFSEGYNNLAAALALKGQFPDAVAYFKKALELAPKYIDARMNLAAVLMHLDKSSAAAEQYQEVLKLEPHHPAARQGLKAAQAQMSSSQTN